MGDGAVRNDDAQGSTEGGTKTSQAKGGQEEMERGLSLIAGKHLCFVPRLHSPHDVAWALWAGRVSSLRLTLYMCMYNTYTCVGEAKTLSSLP
jgi:hypothetical protein